MRNAVITLVLLGLSLSSYAQPTNQWKLLQKFDSSWVENLTLTTKNGILASTANGVYHSLNDGESWLPFGTGLENTQVLVTSIAPDGTLIAGTLNSGIFISTDNGTAWKNTGLKGFNVASITTGYGNEIFAGTIGWGCESVYGTQLHNFDWKKLNNGLNCLNIRQLHSYFGKTLYAGSDNGLFRSDDAGNSWKGIPAFNNHFITALTQNELGYLFVGTNNGLYFSSDNGSTWIANTFFDGVPIRAIATGESQTLCVATEKQIFITYDNSTFFQLGNWNGEGTIKSVVLKNNNLVLVATNSGIYRYLLDKEFGGDCQANFEFVPCDCYPVHYAFNVLGDSTIQNWIWDFGDGTMATGKEMIHQYIAPGEYKVCLTVTDANNCTSTLCKAQTMEGAVFAGSDQVVYDNQTWLKGSSIPNSKGNWTLVAGFGRITEPFNYSTLITDLQPGENIFRWTVYSGDQFFYDDVAVNYLPEGVSAIAKAGNDQVVYTNFAILNAEKAISGYGKWLLLNGQGEFENPTSHITNVLKLSLGKNVFRWMIVDVAGNITFDDVVIEYRNRNEKLYMLPDSFAVWTEYKQSADSLNTKYRYGYLNRDTIINGFVYHQLFSFDVQKRGETPVAYLGAIREDNNYKVFFVPTGQIKEVLLYDFAAQPGTWVTVYGTESFGGVFISYTDSVLVDGAYRKRLQLSNNGYWIDGIGSTNGLLYPYNKNWASQLMTYTEMNKVVYENQRIAQPETTIDYQSFPTTDAVWNIVLYDSKVQTSEVTNVYSYGLSGRDTTIQSKVYHQITEVPTDSSRRASYIGAFREENRRVFVVYASSNEEILLYDFNLDVGESVMNRNTLGSMSSLTVSRIDSVLVDGKLHRRFHFAENPKLTWIEGIGSSTGFLNPYAGIATNAITNELLCFSNGNAVKWLNAGFNDCAVITVAEPRFTASGRAFIGNDLLPKGIAIIFKQNNGYFKAEQLQTVNNGIFKFTNLREGNYKIFVTPDTNQISGYLPTYYGDTDIWSESYTLPVTGNILDIDVHLIVYNAKLTGVGIIAGSVRYETDAVYESAIYSTPWFNYATSQNSTITSGLPASNITVYLYDNRNNRIAWTLTDGLGNFSFDKISWGSYRVSIEKAGMKLKTPSYATITEQQPVVSGVELLLTANDISLTINDQPIYDKQQIKLFPNPFDNQITISCANLYKQNAQLTVYNTIGIVVLTQALLKVNETVSYTLDTSSFPTGFYIAHIVFTNGQTFGYKLIKK